ncbi:MAG: asparagine synthetase B [bacterium]
MNYRLSHVAFIILVIFVVTVMAPSPAWTKSFLIPMGKTQSNHLRAYGLIYHTLSNITTEKVHWLLNYRGGSFVVPARSEIRRWARLKGVTVEELSTARRVDIFNKISSRNMRKVPLEKAPDIAVYTPPGKDPWDDAVTLALTYADIPFDKVYDKEVLDGKLNDYDWVHLHHEDFTGQYGKFYANYRNAPWYLSKVEDARKRAHKLGFESVQVEKKTVAKKISDYVDQGGFLFAMCSAPETIDIALASQGVRIAPPEISGTPIDPQYRKKIVFEKTFAFKNFEIITDPSVYGHSNIDISPDPRNSDVRSERFELFPFSARYDPIPAMLTQNHKQVIKGFLGQTSTFNTDVIKSYVTRLAQLEDGRTKYIYGPYGDGLFSFYAGHDPEDFAHYVGDPHTNLKAHPNSPGYRLILNNILFPAAEKPDLKT